MGGAKPGGYRRTLGGAETRGLNSSTEKGDPTLETNERPVWESQAPDRRGCLTGLVSCQSPVVSPAGVVGKG